MKRSIDEFLVIYLQKSAFYAADAAKQALDVRKKTDSDAAGKKRTSAANAKRPAGSGRRGNSKKHSSCPMSRAVEERGDELFRDYVDEYFTANDVISARSSYFYHFSRALLF
jgi:hypothetical protein